MSRGEYPAGSVACAESSGELEAGSRNRWFILFTNVQIDFGFVVSALVGMIVTLITTEMHLETSWRVCLGLGAIPPLSLLYLRIKLEEPEEFQRESMRETRIPYGLVLRFYGARLLMVSLIWFIYDFSSYSFSLYSSSWIAVILGDTAPLWQSFGFSVVVYTFYLPGAVLGAWASDWVGPRRALAYGVLAQGLVGFLMAGLYPILREPQYVFPSIFFGHLLLLSSSLRGDFLCIVNTVRFRQTQLLLPLLAFLQVNCHRNCAPKF